MQTGASTIIWPPCGAVAAMQQSKATVFQLMNFAAIRCRIIGRQKGQTLLKTHVLGFAAAALLMSVPGMVTGCDALRDGPRGVVTGVTDGDTVVLDSGMVVRLIGMQAPKLPLGREGFESWPKAEEAKQALEELVLGKAVILRHGGEATDRHGRALGHLFLADESQAWVQEAMVAQGLARVYSFPDNRACLAELMAAESRARAMRLGIWTDPYYTVRRADRPAALAERAGHYELVEGRVLLADEAGSRTYLNFGRYWKEDFTVVIEGRASRLFAESGLDPLQLGGALLRVRGWVDNDDGPRIEVTHPEQIEVLATP
ncbi:MAG TPA: thermonuclease family protein [Devosiaceae bacterium]|nr:thermonuclease family protein [Devosiaceae bacterium]